jgi:hypothetical protein
MSIRLLIIVALAAVAVSGCGRRGDLEPPGTVASESTAPAPLIDGISPLDPGAPPVAREQEEELPPPDDQPKRRFFLDFLL